MFVVKWISTNNFGFGICFSQLVRRTFSVIYNLLSPKLRERQERGKYQIPRLIHLVVKTPDSNVALVVCYESFTYRIVRLIKGNWYRAYTIKYETVDCYSASRSANKLLDLLRSDPD